MQKDKLAKINSYLCKSCRFSARHAFLSFLVLVLMSLVLGGFLFYKYSFLIAKIEPEITGKTVQFKEGLYQKVMLELQNRQERFKKADAKKYLDIFR